MQTVINGLTITGTPIEMAELAKFCAPQVEKPKPEQKAAPKPAPKNQNARKELDVGKVKALRKAGWTIDKIADEMGVSAPTISRCLKEAE